MVLEFNDEEKEGLLRTIDILKMFKHLQLLGYTIPPMQFTTTNDDMLSDLEDLGFNVVSIITDGNVELNYVLPSKYDVISMDDDEGYMVIEFIIRPKEVVEYLKATKVLPRAFTDIFYKMIGNQYAWYSDYTVYEAMIPDDHSELRIIISDFLCFDSNFVEKLIELINFCRMELDSRNIKVREIKVVDPIKKKLKNKRKRKNRKRKNRRR